MYSQSIHDLDATDNTSDARTTITASIDGSTITQTVVLCGTGVYGKVNSVNFKATAWINGDQRYIFVDPKR